MRTPPHIKVSITQCRVRGRPKWRARWHECGRIHRKFFGGRAAADLFAAKLRCDAVTVRQQLAALDLSEQEKLMALFNEAQRRGIGLLDFLSMPQSSSTVSATLNAVKTELIAAKTKAGRDVHYLACLGWIYDDFLKGRDLLPINRIGLEQVEQYLDTKSLVSRKTYRSHLSGLFNFAVRRGYMTNNPCERLEPVTVTPKCPHIFTVEETQSCLAWLQKNPRLFGWFVLSTFAGLRPEEAEKTTWSDINFDEHWIRVEAEASKMRQRRVVYPMLMTFDWLKAVKAAGAEISTTRAIRSDGLKELRFVLGLKRWKKDVTRHSCASYWLSATGNASSVADALGHTETMLRKHYIGLCTKADAKRFWDLVPLPS